MAASAKRLRRAAGRTDASRLLSISRLCSSRTADSVWNKCRRSKRWCWLWCRTVALLPTNTTAAAATAARSPSCGRRLLPRAVLAAVDVLPVLRVATAARFAAGREDRSGVLPRLFGWSASSCATAVSTMSTGLSRHGCLSNRTELVWVVQRGMRRGGILLKISFSDRVVYTYVKKALQTKIMSTSFISIYEIFVLDLN